MVAQSIAGPLVKSIAQPIVDGGPPTPPPGNSAFCTETDTSIYFVSEVGTNIFVPE